METTVRHLPDPALIPPCPHCGDREQVQRLICGLPAELPAIDERDRIEFTVCGKDEHSADDDWWCPTCYESYPWTYPFRRALLIEEPWASMMIDGTKTWALRVVSTEIRGIVGLTAWGSGLIAGRAALTDVHGPFTPHDLSFYRDRHRVFDEYVEAYAAGRPLYAWEFTAATRFRLPVPYHHRRGAVIWAMLPESRPVACHTCGGDYEPIHAEHPRCPGALPRAG